MSGFEYVVSNAGFSNPSGSDKFRQFVALHGPERQSKSGSFTISGSLPEESYPATTGVGFEPDLVIITTSHIFGGGGGQAVLSIGAAAQGHQFGTKLDYGSYLGGRDDWCTRYSWQSDTQIIPEIAEFSSFDADGFTLNVANPLGYDLEAAYFAARGAGVYDVGTAVSPSSSGNQSITGLGFKPAAVILISAQQTSLGKQFIEGARMGIGACDDHSREYSIWCGSGTGDIYTNSAARSSALLMAADAASTPCFGGSGFCHPELMNEATLVSMDADGFTLNWSIDPTWGGGARYYHWIAVQQAEVGRFIYNHTSADFFAGTHFPVMTDAIPHGLITYCNDLGHEQLTQNTPSTEGASLAFGGCGDDLSGQWNLTWLDPSRGVGFGFCVPDPTSAIDTGHGSFGCQKRMIGSFALENIDCGEVVTLVGQENFIFGMNFRSATRKGAGGRILHDRRPVT